MEASREKCGICMGSMKAGDGKAMFTAECSHIFHFNCIATNIQHANHKCPICHSTWTNLPSQVLPGYNFFPYFNPNQQPVHSFNPWPYTFQQPSPPVFCASPLEFADDEPLPTPAPSPEVGPTSSTPTLKQAEGIIVEALPEYPALSQSQQSDSFTVLVGIRAPPLSPEATDRVGARAPLDLVAVLDVSGSMQGDKIRLLKQAVNFVVDNLGPTDRFSIVTFSTYAQRVTPLTRMTETGRADMGRAINSLRANGSTNIIAGLRKAVQILEQRREKNPVASIILLSDGQDNQNPPGLEGFYRALSQLPACIRSRNMDSSHNHTQNDVVSVPVHTFGFGSDHDARALHAVADGSGGTFSYIESIEVIQDAFAQCLGGLLSVIAQDVKIQVQSSTTGVGILSISSGRYLNTIHSNAKQQHGVIYVGDLYAEEEKKFLIYLTVPQETDTSITKLLEVQCCYKDLLSNENILSETKIVQIRRPLSEDLSEHDRQVCLEVDRERNRVSVAEGIAQAQAMAERGELDRARSLLDQRRQSVMSSVSAQKGDALCVWLESEVRGIQQQMTSTAQYEAVGRAYAFSKGSSHMYQRAATQAVQMQQQQQQQPQMLQQQRSTTTSGGVAQAFSPPTFGGSGTVAYGASAQAGMGYQTTFMRHMVEKSQLSRQLTKQDEEVVPSGNPKMTSSYSLFN